MHLLAPFRLTIPRAACGMTRVAGPATIGRMANRDDDGTPPRKPTPEEVNARFARLCIGGKSRPRTPSHINTDHLNEVVSATAPPTAREAIAERKLAADVPAHLAEAQVALVGRCTICDKPVTGRDVPRDREGRPRHHRCQ